MEMPPLLHINLCAALLACTSLSHVKARIMYQADFSKPAEAQGWVYKKSKQAQDAPMSEKKGESIISYPGTKWFSPHVKITPFKFYKIILTAKAPKKAYWFAFYYDKDGKFIVADTYSSVECSTDFTVSEGIIRTREYAATVRIGVRGGFGSVELKNAALVLVSDKDALTWSDAYVTKLPALKFKAPAGRHKLIPKTIARLKNGTLTRIVMLGDSIINDTSNSNYELQLRRLYPKMNARIITSVRGGTGVRVYQAEDKHKQYVIDRKPDLLMIGGISNGKNIKNFRTVVQLTRKAFPDCEIMIMTGPMGGDWRKGGKSPVNPLAMQKFEDTKRGRQFTAFRDKLKALCTEEKVAFFDMGLAWHHYLGASGKPYMFFHRDKVHANTPGKEILGRILTRWFAPIKK